MMKTLITRSAATLTAVITLFSFLPLESVSALPKEQKALYMQGINLFDYDVESAVCSAAGSTTGGAGGSGTVTDNLQSFVDAYGQFAYDVGRKNGIPYDAIIAQASVESNYGKSKLNQQANNFFGIKAGSTWTGPTVSMPTKEQDANGNEHTEQAAFRAYPTPEAGFQGYADFLRQNPRYAKVFNYQKDPVGYFQALKDAGYATDVKYVDTLTSRLSAVQKYIASKNLFPPISEVVYEVSTSGQGSPGAAPTGALCSTNAATGNAAGVVAIAIQEAQNWKGTPGEYLKYSDGRAENWCADFVSWVYNAAGRPFVATPGVGMPNSWQIASVSNLQTYLKARGQYWDKVSAPAPLPGDIVIYKNGASHTNIVVEANGYMVKTVGGNQGGGGGQGAFYANSDVTMSKALFDIRNDSTVSGWGRLP